MSVVDRFTVVIPYRSNGDEARDRALRYVTAFYWNLSIPVVYGSLPDGIAWSKGTAIELGVSDVRTDGIIVADSDCLVPPAALSASMAAITGGNAWSMPHGTVYRLSRARTQQLYSRGLNLSGMRPGGWYGPPGGGIVVLSRRSYEIAGAPDPRFTDWGGEDISWARALDTLAGPCARLDAQMWHLWHQRMERRPGNRGSEENEELAGRYLEAAGDGPAMRALVDEHRAPVTG